MAWKGSQTRHGTAAADVRVPSAVLCFARRAKRHAMQDITIVSDRGLLAYYYSRRVINKQAGTHRRAGVDIYTRRRRRGTLEQQCELPRAGILAPGRPETARCAVCCQG